MNGLPYAAKYAESDETTCKRCKMTIPKSALTLAVRVPSQLSDALEDLWYHYDCFWQGAKARHLTIGNIANVGRLHWTDIKKMRNIILEVKSTKVGARRPKVGAPLSATSRCGICRMFIPIDTLRIETTIFAHPACWKAENGGAVETLQGYLQLDETQKADLRAAFASATSSGPISSLPLQNQEKPDEEMELMVKLEQQSDILWKVRQSLTKHLSQKEVATLLTSVGRLPTKHDEKVRLDQLSDFIVFGIPQDCDECKGAMFYNSALNTYECSGNLSAYTPCNVTNRTPKRTPMTFSTTVLEHNDWLRKATFPGLATRHYFPDSENVCLTLAASLSPDGKKALKPSSTSSHVFADQDGVWQVSLNQVDIARNRNSFLKLELVKHDFVDDFCLVKSWGRAGTEQGDFEIQEYGDDLASAKDDFQKIFRETTNNNWKQRQSFKKKAGMMDLIVLEDDPSLRVWKQFDLENSKSNIASPIKEIIATICDINVINDSLKLMDIDMDKFPLGRLSKSQIKSAYGVLEKLNTMLTDGASPSQIFDASNRFYTLIPHASGRKAPQLVDNITAVRDKTALLDNLLEIEATYSLIQQDPASDHFVDSIETYYQRLNCVLDVIDKKSDEFRIISEYLQTNHAPIHDSYKLIIRNVFAVDRNGEAAAFMRDVGNVQLLWHGSLTGNYAGILSQGLRIAPPEAPVTGYMFGKGVYFADMVSKSANYCHASIDDDGFLLLCEVALGEIQREKKAKNITAPNEGKQSVQGVGQIYPGKTIEQVILNGAIVPIGEPTTTRRKDLPLMHNEFIVYDEAQVCMKYLVQVTFVSPHSD